MLAGALGSTYSFASDLWDVYQQALVSDPTYQAALHTFESNQIQLPLAKSAFKPTITASGTLGRQRSDFTGTTQTSDNHSANLNFGFPLYDKASRINIEQAALSVENAGLQLKQAQHALILRVAGRYFGLLGALDNAEVAEFQKISIQRQMDLAQERLDVGLGTKTDLFDAKARYQQALADLIVAENQINSALQAIRELTGQNPGTINTLSDEAPLESPSPEDLSSWINLALENSIPYQAQLNNLAIAQQEIKVQRLGRLPTVSLDANQRWTETGSGAFDAGNTSSIGLTINIPLYQAGRIRLQSQQAGLQFNAVEQQTEIIKRRISSTITNAYFDVISGIGQVNALAEAVVAGSNALQAKEEGFSAGLTTNLDVLDAQRDLSRSQTDYLVARYTTILANLRLKEAAGLLDESELESINQWLVK